MKKGNEVGTTSRQQAIVEEYGRLAAVYDRRWKFYIEATTQATMARLPLDRGVSLIDVGCGTGALLSALAVERPDLQLAGVDPSAEMLARARARLPNRVELRQAEATTLPFPDRTFDVVVSTSAFHYFLKPAAALIEMRRVLRSGGSLVITDWCHDYWTCRLCDIYLRWFDRAHQRMYRTRDCRQLLDGAGFVVEKIERYKISWLWGMMTARGTLTAQ